MKLGILLCDQVSPGLSIKHGQYPEMFMNLLEPVHSDIDYTVYNLVQGEFPKDINATDAYLISGSRFSVYEDIEWIKQLEELVRRLHSKQKKLIGICFGHQMIAQALGGKVIKSPKGWGVGMSQNRVYNHKEWMNPDVNEFNILVSHRDQVVEIPTGSEILAGSDFCPNYLMQIGSHILTIQGHPEFTKEYCKDLMISKEDQVTEAEFAHAIKSMELNEDDHLIAQWIIRFLFI